MAPPVNDLRMGDSRVSNLSAGRIALGYAAIAILWIAFSDAVVTRLNLRLAVMTIKGVVFVFATASLLYFTIKRLVEAARLTSQERDQTATYLAEAQRLSHTGSWALDVATGEYAYWSEEMFRIFAFDPQLGPPKVAEVLKRIEPEERADIERAIGTSFLQKDTEFEFQLVPPDGKRKHLHCLTHPVLGPKGEVVEVMGTVVDITERKRAKEALRQNEAYLMEAQRLSHTGSFAFDVASDKYFYISEECFRIFGLDPQQGFPTRQAISGLIHPEDWDRVREDFDRLLREKVDTPSEFRIVLPGGAIKHIHAIRHPVVNDAGETTTIVGTAIDITERKQAEQALRESEKRFRAFWDHAADAFAVFDEQHKIIDVNREACEAGGYTREEVIGMVPQDFDPDVDAAMLQRIEERIEAGEICTFESRNRRKDGTVFPVEVRVRPFWLGGRRLHLAVSRDISERKRAEEALRESDTRLRTFVDHAADAFFMLDFDTGIIIDANRTACESLGYAREELIGKTPLAFDMNLDRATLESLVERAAAGETVLFDRHRHRRKDGSTFPVEIHTSVFWHGGRRFLLKVARDITDRVRAEEQRDRLRQLEGDLAHINRVSMMGELAASIAHEVNQPLSGVVSNASAGLRWLDADTPNLDETREGLRRIVRDGKRAAEVIARVRALAKRAGVPQEKLDLNETIREVFALVGDEAKRKNVIVRTQFADDLSPVMGDRVQLQQLVLNLVMNGIEAMSGVGERPRELIITTQNKEAGEVRVTVEDSGVGLDPTTMQKMFDAFYTTKPGGMGMGLSISRSILQAHGGRLWAAAKDGPGTVFHFTLPQYHEEEANAGIAAV